MPEEEKKTVPLDTSGPDAEVSIDNFFYQLGFPQSEHIEIVLRELFSDAIDLLHRILVVFRQLLDLQQHSLLLFPLLIDLCVLICDRCFQ